VKRSEAIGLHARRLHARGYQSLPQRRFPSRESLVLSVANADQPSLTTELSLGIDLPSPERQNEMLIEATDPS
jgi:hypothetical protein